MYSERLLDYFQHPRNSGELPGANVTVRQENPVCGDIVELSALVREGRIETIRFRAKGCVPSMACASAVCELAEGKQLSAVREVSKREVLSSVGGVPAGSDHAAELAIEALKTLLRTTAQPGKAESEKGNS